SDLEYGRLRSAGRAQQRTRYKKKDRESHSESLAVIGPSCQLLKQFAIQECSLQEENRPPPFEAGRRCLCFRSSLSEIDSRFLLAHALHRSRLITANVLDAFAAITGSWFRMVITSASTKISVFPARNTCARQETSEPEAGRRKEVLFSTVITSRPPSIR